MAAGYLFPLWHTSSSSPTFAHRVSDHEQLQISVSAMADKAKAYLRPGSWLVQGTLGLAYPGSFKSHSVLAKWQGRLLGTAAKLTLCACCKICGSDFLHLCYVLMVDSWCP